MRSSRPIATLIALASFLIFSAMSLHAAEHQHPLRVGAAKVDITPTDLVGLNEFGNGNFTGIHDHIYARVLVMNNGVNSAAIVALDLVELGDTTQIRQRIQRELGIPADHIIIDASHDHVAPRIGAVTPGALAHPETKQDKAYTSFVYGKIIEALKEAKASLQPAKFGIAKGKAYINANRDLYVDDRGWVMGYNPNGISDRTVWVLKFESLSGKPIAILFNYAVHSTVTLGTNEVSGDLGGAAERYVEARYGNKIVALYTMGPAGDQNPILNTIGWKIHPPKVGPGSRGKPQPAARAGQSTVPPNPFKAMNALGLVLGSEVVHVANRMRNLTPDVRLEASEKTFTCPVKRGVNQMSDMKQASVSSVPIHLSLILLNNMAITGVSGEVVTRIYWRLKKNSPLTNTLLITIANDRAGYIVNDSAYDTGDFEVNGTPFARGCAENGIVNGLVGMIDKSLF